MVVLVDNGEFLDFVLLQNLGGSSQVCLLVGSHQIILSHHLINLLVQTALKTQVTVGDNTHKTILFVNDRNTTDMILSHDIECVLYGRTATDGNGIINHTILCSFDNSDLTGLILDRHILVDNTNTTFTGNSNSHPTFRNRIHSCRHKRHVQLDMTRETSLQFYSLRKYLRISGNQQDVVKCQAVHNNLVCNK